MMKGSSECTALKNPGRLFLCIALSLVFALQITGSKGQEDA